MTIFYWVFGIVVWLACGIVSWGFWNGGRKKRFPFFGSNIAFGVFDFILGPFALFGSLMVYGSSNFDIKPISKADAWAAHQKEFPTLSYKSFEATYRP